MRLGWHSTASIDAPAIVAASGCAPPMPPSPAVRIQLPGQIAAVVLAAHLDEGLVGALHDALAADVDPRARRHLAVHHQALAVELVEVLPASAQCGTRLELAISTRGASACVRKTPTGLPDCTSSVSSAFERAQRGDDAVEALPVARGAADAAVDHQLVRLLGDLGVEVVHQHAQRRLGQPALGRELVPRGARMVRALSMRVMGLSSGHRATGKREAGGRDERAAADQRVAAAMSGAR